MLQNQIMNQKQNEFESIIQPIMTKLYNQGENTGRFNEQTENPDGPSVNEVE